MFLICCNQTFSLDPVAVAAREQCDGRQQGATKATNPR